RRLRSGWPTGSFWSERSKTRPPRFLCPAGAWMHWSTPQRSYPSAPCRRYGAGYGSAAAQSADMSDDGIDIGLTLRVQVTDPTALAAFTMTAYTDTSGVFAIDDPVGGQDQQVQEAVLQMLAAAFANLGEQSGLRLTGLSGTRNDTRTAEEP